MQEIKAKKIGFIGLGIMGRAMAANLMKNGFHLNVFNRTPSKSSVLVDMGAHDCESIQEVAQKSSFIISIVGFPADVESVYFGKNGLLENSTPGTLCIDMTTSKPSLAKKIDEQAKVKGIEVLDAPVSGGDVGAKNAELSIMVGGEEKSLLKALPIFEVLGNQIVHHGPAGSGQNAKLCNQIAIAGALLGVCEALSFASKTKLNGDKVIKSIGSGAGTSWQLQNLGPKMLQRQFEPGFTIKHFLKDLRIAWEEAEEMGYNPRGLKTVIELLTKMEDRGWDLLGTQALFKLFE